MSIEEIQAQLKRIEERRKQLEARIADIKRRQEREAEAKRTRAKIFLAELLVRERRAEVEALLSGLALNDTQRELFAILLPPPPPPAPQN
jgi:septal ring factor EnvC (AmiA/AmiB activator)